MADTSFCLCLRMAPCRGCNVSWFVVGTVWSWEIQFYANGLILCLPSGQGTWGNLDSMEALWDEWEVGSSCSDVVLYFILYAWMRWLWVSHVGCFWSLFVPSVTDGRTSDILAIRPGFAAFVQIVRGGFRLEGYDKSPDRKKRLFYWLFTSLQKVNRASLKKIVLYFCLNTEAIIRKNFLSCVLFFYTTFLKGENLFDDRHGYVHLTWWMPCKSTANEGTLTGNVVSRYSSFGIETRCGLYGSGIEFVWGARFFTLIHIGPGAHPASCTVSTGSLVRG
jgi:hypothetical protein